MYCELHEKSNQGVTISANRAAESLGRSRKLEKKWTDKEIQVMVELIKNREAIWNRGSLSYKNRYIKSKCWIEIANKTNHSVIDAKIQWNTIKSRFNSERNKVLMSKKEKDVATYSPRYDLYKSLQFLLKDNVQPFRRTASNLVNKTDSRDNIEDSFSSPVPTPNASGILAVSKKREFTPSFTPAPPQNHQRSALMNEISGFLKSLQEAPTKNKWKKVFCEYIFCELDRYEEHDAQNLKNQLTMVCVNFQQGKDNKIIDTHPKTIQD